MNYDVIIVGAGPAGIFTAYELNKNKPNSNILLIEGGRSIDKRFCPKIKTINNPTVTYTYLHLRTKWTKLN